MAILTFSAVSGSFKAQIWKRNPATFVADIDINVPFNTAPYAPAQVWQMATNEIRIYPDDDGAILSVENDPLQHSIQWEQDGEFFKTVQLISSSWQNFTVLVTVSGGQDIVSPYNRVYWVDSGIISEFASLPAIIPSEPNQPEKNSTDYIIGLLNVPFKLPDGLKGETVSIVLGGRDTQINAPVMASDLITVPLGEISITGLSDNSIDYVATEYDLILPYLPDVIKLSPEWIIGKVITGEYIIDAYTGDVTVNIYNGENTPVATVKSAIGRTIPFRTFNTVTADIGTVQGASNNVFSAYIRKSKKVLAGGDFSNMVVGEGDIGDFSGYIQVENIDLETSATLGEQNQIKSILASGVIIK